MVAEAVVERIRQKRSPGGRGQSPGSPAGAGVAALLREHEGLVKHEGINRLRHAMPVLAVALNHP
jgi:hypothetical protein